jgi:superfamily I DNA/RNA helicase
LLKQVKHEATEYGTPISGLTFSTFTKSQTAEVAGRIRDIYPDASGREIGSSVCTLHAAARRSCTAAGILGSDAEIIIEGRKKWAEHFVGFCKAHHLPYDLARAQGSAPDDDRGVGNRDEPAGNVLFKVARYIVCKYTWEWKHAPRALDATGLNFPSSYGDLAEHLQAWSDYKREHRLFEHDDYVRLAIEENAPPLAPVLFVDEFQDLSPLQYVLFTQWQKSGDLERVYVAGDPNQAIYGFRGADPIFLNGLPDVIDIGARGDQIPVSRRCPPEIVRVADQVLGARSNMSPREGVGGVDVLSPCDAREFAALVASLHQQYGHVMILTRYTRYISPLSKVLTAAGIPHTSINRNRITIWEKINTPAGETVDPCQVLAALDAIAVYERDGCPWTLQPSQARALVSSARHLRIPLIDAWQFITDHPAVHINEVIGWFTDKPHPGMAQSIAAGLNFPAPLAAGFPLAFNRPDCRIPKEITIDTIHAAKGLESPAVVLHTGYLKKRSKEYCHSPTLQAEERRVYYTACTRAAKHLVILDGLRSGPSAPPLQVIPGVR